MQSTTLHLQGSSLLLKSNNEQHSRLKYQQLSLSIATDPNKRRSSKIIFLQKRGIEGLNASSKGSSVDVCTLVRQREQNKMFTRMLFII